jgi:hypothetical protein
MIDLEIPGRTPLLLEYLFFDLHDTLSFDGVIEPAAAGKRQGMRGTKGTRSTRGTV